MLLLLGPSHVETYSIEGTSRQAIVIAPSKPSRNPPIVFGWHGHGGTMAGSVNLFRIQVAWPEAIVVYPQGLPIPAKVDPQGLKPGWQFYVGDHGDRDLKFFDAMYARLEHEYSFNPKRVYTMGFSNGADFSYLLWFARPDQIAAVGEAAGKIDDQSKPLKAKPAFLMAGQKDTTDPFPDQLASIKEVRSYDGVAPGAHPQMANGIQFYHGSGADLAVYIHSGGHMYPQNMTPPLVMFFKNHHM